LSQAPDDPALLDTLAAALAETGHYEQAAGTAARAAGLAAAQGDTELSAALTARAALYRSQTPYRTTPH
jgi:hypothetical protein